MRWSVRLILIGVVIILAGFIPPLVSGLSIGTAESTASIAVIGILVLLLGLLLRRVQKALKRG